MSFVTKLKRQMAKPETGPQQQGVAAVRLQSLAGGFQSPAQGQPGGMMGVSAQGVVHHAIIPPVGDGTNFVKRLKRIEAYTESLLVSQGQCVATERRQLGHVAQLVAPVHSDPVGGNLVRLIKQEKLEPLPDVAPTVVSHRGGLPSWFEMQRGDKRGWSDHFEGGAHSKRHRAQSGSDSDSDGSCSSQLDAEQENLLAELLEDSAPDSTLGQDKSHWRTWVDACAEAGICGVGCAQEHAAQE